MHKAFESRKKFKDGKVVEHEWSIGPIVVVGLVGLVLGLAGKAIVSIPSFSQLLK